MTVSTLESVKALIAEMEVEGTAVGSAWQYTNAMNGQTMFAVFPASQYCDIFESPYVEKPKQIWAEGKFLIPIHDE